MGLEVVIQNERGEVIDQVGDGRNYLHRLLPRPEDQSYQCLRFVDWYGDTIFNYLQMDQLLAEMERLRQRSQCKDEDQLIQRIQEMAQRCKETRHCYLKFVGD